MRQIVSDSVAELRNEMTNLVTNELRSIMQNMNNNNSNDNNIPNNNNRNVSNPINNDIPSSSSNVASLQEPFVVEKVSNIIRNWKVKFSGSEDQMTVDEFVYRINILTTNSLNGTGVIIARRMS